MLYRYIKIHAVINYAKKIFKMTFMFTSLPMEIYHVPFTILSSVVLVFLSIRPASQGKNTFYRDHTFFFKITLLLPTVQDCNQLMLATFNLFLLMDSSFWFHKINLG